MFFSRNELADNNAPPLNIAHTSQERPSTAHTKTAVSTDKITSSWKNKIATRCLSPKKFKSIPDESQGLT